LGKFLKYWPPRHGEVGTRSSHLDPEFSQQLMGLDTFTWRQKVKSQ
jgi:hypothetical protein